jgi:very-long-chain enoyl-CoA reductase
MKRFLSNVRRAGNNESLGEFGKMKLTVCSSSNPNRVVETIDDLPEDATVLDLKKHFQRKKRKYYPSRQRFMKLNDETKEKTTEKKDDNASSSGGKKKNSSSSSSHKGEPLVPDTKKLSEFGIGYGDTILFKDLGPQISYQAVFFWEYFGPLMMYLPFYFYREKIYGGYFGFSAKECAKPFQRAQVLALWFHSAHYAKRIFETFFVHSFSRATMPIFNLIRNCGYYWTFAGLMSYFINHPRYTSPGERQVTIGFVLSALFQLGNFRCHVIQKRLRSSGSSSSETKYVIPSGFLFDYVTCANYCCEIYQWLGFNIATQTAFGYLFLLAGMSQMFPWAVQKHKRLKKLFDGTNGRKKFKRRFIVLPPFF